MIYYKLHLSSSSTGRHATFQFLLHPLQPTACHHEPSHSSLNQLFFSIPPASTTASASHSSAADTSTPSSLPPSPSPTKPPSASFIVTIAKIHLWTIASVLLLCLSIAAIQALLSFFNPLENRLSVMVRETSVVVINGFKSNTAGAGGAVDAGGGAPSTRLPSPPSSVVLIPFVMYLALCSDLMLILDFIFFLVVHLDCRFVVDVCLFVLDLLLLDLVPDLLMSLILDLFYIWTDIIFTRGWGHSRSRSRVEAGGGNDSDNGAGGKGGARQLNGEMSCNGRGELPGGILGNWDLL